MTEKYKVYEYVFPNEMIYIGMTKLSLSQRRDCGYQHNLKLKTAIKQAGWINIKKIILEDGLSKEEACQKEIEWIAKLKADNPSIGFNISKGGTATYAGLKHTQDFKQHLSSLLKGRVISETTLQRMKEARKKQSKPVKMLALDGKEIKQFKSLGDAATAINGYKSNISRACENGKPYKNYLWVFERR